MARAEGRFEASWLRPQSDLKFIELAGIEAIAWPVDYRSAGNERLAIDITNPVLNLNTTGVAVREWIGLAAYKATGRISDWFPGPNAADNL